jgi:ribosomal peptide maturation radical SAM protein 1
MNYRSKSQKRALREIVYLTSRYPNHPVTVVDNILDMHYFKEFVPELAARKMKLELFYETKANLKKEQVALMYEAGFTSVQPGIESFSNQVLALMGKGIKAVQNIQVLKWFKEFRIKPYWNLIWGFPGEDPQEYYRMAKFLPLLTHLPSPYSACRIRLDRFSPNFEFAEQKGFRDVEPYPAYSYIYQIPPENIRNLAYFFRYQTDPNIAVYTAPLQKEITQWWENQETSDLFFIDHNGRLLIWDFRPVAQQTFTVLTRELRELYILCDSAKSVADLQRATGLSTTVLEEKLGRLVESRLLFEDHRLYVSLAVRLGLYVPNEALQMRMKAAGGRY